MLLVTTYGTLLQTYIGLGSAPSSVKKEVMLSSLRTRWNERTVARDIRRAQTAIENAWPEWMPPQKVAIEVHRYDHRVFA